MLPGEAVLTTKVRPLARFRIYPEKGRSRLHFIVLVFRNVEDMRRHLRTHPLAPRRLGRYGKAMCSTWIEGYTASGRVTPCMGEIVFAQRWSGAGVIAHECTHAALGWARRLGLSPMEEPGAMNRRRGHRPVSDLEERFCYALGELTRQVAVQLWTRKLIS